MLIVIKSGDVLLLWDKFNLSSKWIWESECIIRSIICIESFSTIKLVTWSSFELWLVDHSCFHLLCRSIVYHCLLHVSSLHLLLLLPTCIELIEFHLLSNLVVLGCVSCRLLRFFDFPFSFFFLLFLHSFFRGKMRVIIGWTLVLLFNPCLLLI